MDKIASIILRYRILFLVLIGLLTGLFGHYAIKSKTDNSIEVWLKHNDPTLDYYYDFIDKFGDDEFLIIAMDGDDLFTGKKLKLINDIATRLEEVNGVRSVMSLAGVYKDKLSAPYFKEVLKRNKTRSFLDVFKEKILVDPMYVNNVISNDGKTTAIIATVAKGSPESRVKLVKETREILRVVEIENNNELLKEGIIAGASMGKELLRFLPPLTITEKEIAILEEKIIKAFSSII